jgi:hypothetical protein
MLGGMRGQVNESRGYYALRGFCYTLPRPPRWITIEDTKVH